MKKTEIKISSATYRLRELDFLRGIAILLVLFRHQYVLGITYRIGWIGVDLFFVLSGFLISGLLFREYLKYGNIQPIRFLVRRGFKIYPVYYTFYILYLIPIILQHQFSAVGFLSDMTFTQNYVWGWGFAIFASWSLAIEEHFYVTFALLMWLGTKKRAIHLQKSDDAQTLGKTGYVLLMLMGCCLLLRIISNIIFPNEEVKNFTMTHLRIDSLMAGVFVSYLYHFRINYLSDIYTKHKIKLLVIACLSLLFTPFLNPLTSFFVKTFGFSLLYISFSIVLVVFIMEKNINQQLNSIFSTLGVNSISKIGAWSYSIYIIHTYINNQLADMTLYNHFIKFMISTAISIIAGMLMTNYFENYFLRQRDKYYPRR